MLKKIGFVTAAAAATLLMLGGAASANEVQGGDNYPVKDSNEQTGLVNLSNTDVLHNVNVDLGLCNNDINVLGVQVPVRDVLNGLGVPILSKGQNQASNQAPYNCSSASLSDGGTVQGN